MRNIFVCVSLVSCALSVTARPVVKTSTTPTAAARFLEQASWGPTDASVSALTASGFDAYIADQLQEPTSGYPEPSGVQMEGLGPAQSKFFFNAVSGSDQLRQRVSFALSQIFVVSADQIHYSYQLIPYLDLLQKYAFSNYYDVMRAVTLSPAMGAYLNMVNNDKANPLKHTSANENYARELLQLFTIGEVLMNSDGSTALDKNNKPIPAYTEMDVTELARVFTGWTYPTKPFDDMRAHNPANWDGPMEPFAGNHDTGSKVLLGNAIPAGLSAEQDLDMALRIIFQNSTLGPFIVKQLIKHLVTSNPSADYMSRVTAVFNSDPVTGKRGELQAVVRAILLDPEARAGDTGQSLLPLSGHLREPVYFIASLLRALNANITEYNALPGNSSGMGQNLFHSPSVFNYFSPNYRIAGKGINAPEFQIFSPATAISRINFVNTLVYGNLGAETAVDFEALEYALAPLKGDSSKLIDWANTILLHGQMAASTKQIIMTALAPLQDVQAKLKAIVYLTASSAEYQVEH